MKDDKNINYDDLARGLANYKKSLQEVDSIQSDISKKMLQQKQLQEKIKNDDIAIKSLKDKDLNLKGQQLDIAHEYLDCLKKEHNQLKENLQTISSIIQELNFKGISRDITESLFNPLERFLSKLPGSKFLTNMLGLDDVRSKVENEFTGILKNLSDTGISTKSLGSAFKNFGKVGVDAIGSISKAMLSNPITAMVVAVFALYKILQSAVERWMILDKAAGEFRKETGFTVEQTKKLEQSVRSITKEYAYLGVNAEDVYKSAKALSSEFNGMLPFVKKNVEFTTLMSKSFGVVSEDTAKVLKNFMGISGETEDSAKNAILYATQLAKASGVPLPLVMKDVASASENTMIYVGKTADDLVRAATNARRLGTTIDGISNSMDSVLNFQESIGKEMEFATLSGRHINLNAMRQAAFSKDGLSYEKELVKVLDQAGDVTEMNVFQQKALAKMLGMSVGEIKNMQAQQKTLNELEKADPSLFKKYTELLKGSKEVKKDAVATATAELRKAQLMSQQEQIMGNLNQLWMDIADILYPIVDILVKVLVPTLKVVGGLFSFLIKPISFILENLLLPVIKTVDLISSSVQYLSSLWNKFSKIVEDSSFYPMLELVRDITPSIGKGILWVTGLVIGLITVIGGAISLISGIGTIVASVSAAIATGTGILSSVAGIIGIITSATVGLPILIAGAVVGAIYLIYKQWDNIKGLISKSVDFIKSIGKKVLEFYIWPYKTGWMIIKKIFSSDMVYQIGNVMVNGIKKIGSFILDALVYPFKTAWKWIEDLFIGHSPSELGLGIVRGIQSIEGMLLDALLTPFKFAFIAIEKIAEGIKGTFSTILDLSKNAEGLFSVASGITAISAAMLTLSASSLTNKLTSMLPGKDQFSSLTELAKLAPELNMIGTSIQIISDAGDMAAEALSNMADSVDQLGKSLEGLSEIKLATLTALTLAGAVNNNNKESEKKKSTTNEDVVAKLDELITLMKNGGISVNMDGRKVSSTLASAS